MEELLKRLRNVASGSPTCEKEGFDLNDYAGGNIDDAYQLGYDDGKIHLAQDLLSLVEK